MTEDQLEQECLAWLADAGWQHRCAPDIVPDGKAPERNNHRLLVAGVPVQYQQDGETRGDFVRLVDWADPAQNEWLAVNQFSVTVPHHTRRPACSTPPLWPV
jgi:type I restriction enzyme, R subunit